MGTELARARIKEEDIDFPAVPPGFESCVKNKLKKVENTESVVHNLSEKKLVSVKLEPELGVDKKILRPNRRRQCSSSEDFSCGKLDQKISTRTSLPKGVIRGCPECKTCQQVLARYKPEAACRPNLEEAPTFHPTEEEFEDTLSYIAKIRPHAEPYGICRIVPPPSWKPPSPLHEKMISENSSFSTRVQRVDKLQNREPAKKTYNNHTRKKRRCSKTGTSNEAKSGDILEFGFETGPEFTLGAFRRYAHQFKAHYFGGLDIPNDTIEGEYWRIVESPTEEIEVLYGADLDSVTFGSGFPRTIDQACSSDVKYVKSGWNLNNLPTLPGSALSYESTSISGVQAPWLYVGMCFSSFCWHVEDHYLYSLNYMHFGDPKLWYGVPGKDATKMEEAMKKHLPNLFAEQPNLLHNLVTQLSPTILKSEGVPVYRCIQSPGEFVITFPRAYHGGFNCGFNCAEAVNVAPLDWFPHGQVAVELYREQRRKTTISHDKLLLGAAMEAVKANWEFTFLKKKTDDNLRWKNVCGDKILSQSLKARVNMERARRDLLSKSGHALKMTSDFDAKKEKECTVCYFDLHLSAAGCVCSPDKYVCLNHANDLCLCSATEKFFLFRYDIDELDLLIEATEGKLSSVYRWARSHLGLSLPSLMKEETRKKTPPHVTFVVGKKSMETKPDSDKPNAVSVGGTKFRIKKPTLTAPEVSTSSVKQEAIFVSDDTEAKAESIRSASDKKPDLLNENLAGVVIALGVPQRVTEIKDENPRAEKRHQGKKGRPCIGKVVESSTYFNVEPIEFGTVVSGKPWSCARSIFPKGFKSRVKYINVLDPTTTCHYISEVLDWGPNGPLFTVSLEDNPTEVFAHVTPRRCWDMVRERVNQEITEQTRLGNARVPRLQPPGSLDGFEMFGFTSPPIIQAIEALDANRVSVDYWNARPRSSRQP